MRTSPYEIDMIAIANRKLLLIFAVAWLVLALTFVVYTTRSHRTAIETELQQQSATLHRLVSQRADQHDAHLTSLSALALAGDRPEAALFLEVAAAIRRFFPRIEAVDLVPLPSETVPLTTRRDGKDVASVAAVIQAAAQRSTGKLMIVPSPVSSSNFLVVKRTPNNDQARFGLALEIDARALIETDAAYWRNSSTVMMLTLPDGTLLTRDSVDPKPTDPPRGSPMTFQKTLGSRTQPLVLTAQLVPLRGDLFPVGRIVAGLTVIGILMTAAALVTHLFFRTRRAEMRARLGEQGARIAHASRVNALGEMASGMAHELTQPLTAILSQSQAGARLIARDDTDRTAIADILSGIVAQSRRAADVLSRLRHWTKKSDAAFTNQSLNECILNVTSLLKQDANRLEIELAVRLDPANPSVLGDAVEIEQVIFNLARNAMEALEHHANPNRRIQIKSMTSGQEAVLDVIDNGPGIPSAMRDRLFEPFATGKQDGMGLGLVLCERIVERFGGRIDIDDAESGGVRARVFLPLTSDRGAGP